MKEEGWVWDAWRQRYVDPHDRNKRKEQKMRNVISVLDKNVPMPRIADLKQGQMFRYPKGSNDQNVYMVTVSAAGRAVILLATGQFYSDFDHSREIEVIDSININRPLF